MYGGEKMIWGLSFLILTRYLEIVIFTQKSTINELEEHWNTVLKNKICIPAHEIFIGNEDEIAQCIPQPI